MAAYLESKIAYDAPMDYWDGSPFILTVNKCLHAYIEVNQYYADYERVFENIDLDINDVYYDEHFKYLGLQFTNALLDTYQNIINKGMTPTYGLPVYILDGGYILIEVLN